MAGGGENHVRVPRQLLHDLLVLEVPDVDLVVLATRHDPLAASHGEVGEHAILLVLVSGIRLQTFTLNIEKHEIILFKEVFSVPCHSPRV